MSKEKKLRIRAADLFCGAGGTSTGMVQACEALEKMLGVKIDLQLMAVNHWPVAIETHSANHKFAQHLCHGLDGVNPRELFPDGLDFLVASPECTHHSNARGGKPMSDQSRASGWHVVRWIEALQPKFVLIENVREFKSWGPLGKDGHPLKSQKGKTYDAFIAAIDALGYKVDDNILNAADYGDPTTRERLFILCLRGRVKSLWPMVTHSRRASRMIVAGIEVWRSARKHVIDWSIISKSIFLRKKPLARATLRRAFKGLLKTSDPEVRPILLRLYRYALRGQVPKFWPAHFAAAIARGASVIVGQHTGGLPRSVDEPVPTVATSGAVGIAESVILPNATAAARAIEEPVSTIHGAGCLGLFEPAIVPFFGERANQEPRFHSVDAPLPTVTSHGAGGLVEPTVIPVTHQGDDRNRSVDQPLPTVTTAHRGELGLIEPTIIRTDCTGGKRAGVRSIDEPVPTVVGSGGLGVVEPRIVEFYGGAEADRRSRSVDEPLPTQTCEPRFGLAEPVIIGAGGPTGSGKPQSVDEPLKTVIGENHKGVVEPVVVTSGGPERAARSADEPIGTVMTKEHHAVAEAHLLTYYSNGGVKSLDEPMPTVTTRDRAAIIEMLRCGEAVLDIRFRMLVPRELARAQGFPDDYVFTGKRADVIKQIGNAVPVGLAKNLCLVGIAQILNLVRRNDGVWSFPERRKTR